MTNESKIHLIIKLNGQLGKPSSNTGTKHYTSRDVTECTMSINISPETIQYFISDEGRVHPFNSNQWKRLSKIQKIEANLKYTSDNFQGKSFSYVIID